MKQKLTKPFLIYFSVLLVFSAFLSCSKKSMVLDEETPYFNANLSRGADVSWLPQMEASGFKFYNKDGKEMDCLQILKDNGINSIRLRTWVNPSSDPQSGHCSAQETVDMAVRCQNMGFRIMINFHYSDSWADPGKQFKPAAWKDHSFSQLKDDVYNYTLTVMSALKDAGVEPEWVQVGNEINSGMLHPEGSSDNMSNLTQLINKGYDAVKEISPKSLVVIHLANGSDNSLFKWFFDGITQNQGKYDVIGMSYYPFWDKVDSYTQNFDDLSFNVKDMISRYGKKVMVVETGGVDIEVDETYNLLSAVIGLVGGLPNENGLGVMYWEPQGAKSWSGYGLSCWNSNGKPTRAIEAFMK